MERNDALYQAYCAILREELVPATGCTEPIALAYCAAKARHALGRMPDRVRAQVSGNIIKNVKSVTVPNTGGQKGIRAAVAAGIVAGDVQFLRLPLCVHQSGPQPAKGFLRIGDGVEEQQVFLGDLLHLVFILSELPYLVEVFSIIHKGGEKICLNLSRHPDFCENFKKIAGFSEKQGKPRLFWQKISKRTEIFPAGTKLREKTGPPPADPSGIALQFSV